MNMQAMLRQAQAMQKDMMKAKEEIENTVFEGVASSGLVKVEINGAFEMISVKIDPSVVDPEDVEMLQDLIVVAVNDALKKVEDTTASTMGKFTQGMNLPF